MPPEDEPSAGLAELAAGVRRGEKLAVARALNLVEDRRAVARERVAELLDHLREESPRGHRVGLTGPPGVGKSTLAAALARTLRERERTVGVVAVDPSSVRSGGALLGDRARMGFDPRDAGVFVRSLATGGEAGGLSWATHAAVLVLAAAYELVLVETTGVGQTETDVRHVADTVALVVQPGSGDVLQFLKAGVMEIPDVLVVNKADHAELAQRAVSDLRGALRTAASAGAGQDLPIVPTSATGGTGLGELVDALDAHRAALAPDLGARRREGEGAWALQLFARQHGEHGVTTLGGRRALEATIAAALDEAAPPLVASRLGDRYLDALRADGTATRGTPAARDDAPELARTRTS
ncbi:MAG TPA: GTP-binding protein [Polyangiaceae bacterium LLY-WYZ-15_(1-7)]|nr:GTP-binding protein [Polyangiaceae bacterium LLY-WYZ-15_(1-7)]